MYFTGDSLLPENQLPLMIAAAPYGPMWMPPDCTPEQKPPVTWEEQAQAAVDCFNAGATLLHIHVRDPKTGHISKTFKEYGEQIGRLRKAVPKMILQVGGSISFAPEAAAPRPTAIRCATAACIRSPSASIFSDRRSPVTRRFLAAALIVTLWPAASVRAQTPTNPPASPTPSAAEENPGNGWNVWENKAFTTTLILTLGADVAGFVQDDANIEQVGAQPTLVKWRAERINLGGKLNFAKPWVWQVGGNFNGLEAEKGERWSWLDVRLDIPVWDGGRVRIGRQKVGVGMEWELPLVDWAFMERSSTSNAFVPQRNVGVLVTGLFARQRGTWSAGWFNDWFAKDNSFSGNGNQYSARVTLLPVDADNNGDALVEVGAAVLYKEATNGNLQYRARPEINQSDYFVDTGGIAGDHSVTSQFEAMVFKGPLQIFGEAHMTSVSSRETGNPFFFGGFAGVAYVITGEHRGYNRAGGFQTRLVPASPISRARPGLGALEVAARYSYVDLTDGAVDGGVMSRWTGAVSWYLTREWKLQINYGYTTLDLAGTRGHAHGISSRVLWNM